MFNDNPQSKLSKQLSQTNTTQGLDNPTSQFNSTNQDGMSRTESASQSEIPNDKPKREKPTNNPDVDATVPTQTLQDKENKQVVPEKQGFNQQLKDRTAESNKEMDKAPDKQPDQKAQPKQDLQKPKKLDTARTKNNSPKVPTLPKNSIPKMSMPRMPKPSSIPGLKR